MQEELEYPRVDVGTMTRLTAPERCAITQLQVEGRHVLRGGPRLFLIGQLGVNYHLEYARSGLFFLRRWDVPARHDPWQ